MEEVSNLYIISDFTYAAENEDFSVVQCRDILRCDSALVYHTMSCYLRFFERFALVDFTGNLLCLHAVAGAGQQEYYGFFNVLSTIYPAVVILGLNDENTKDGDN